MIVNLIYVLIAGILLFVLYLAVKAITRGVEAKGENNSDPKSKVSEMKKDMDEMKNIMKIGSKWDRISECYVTNYEEIFNKGLPFFESISPSCEIS